MSTKNLIFLMLLFTVLILLALPSALLGNPLFLWIAIPLYLTIVPFLFYVWLFRSPDGTSTGQDPVSQQVSGRLRLVLIILAAVTFIIITCGGFILGRMW